MKILKVTTEARAYTELEAKEYIESFRLKAAQEGYTVAAAGYTYKTKKKKGEVIAEAWVCKCVAEYNPVWEEDEA
jgi:DNA-binding transcriptional regulator YhcF (GntR family)